MAGFLSRLVTKICHVLRTRKTVDDDEVAPRRNAVRTYKVPKPNLLTTRTMDDEDAPGLKAVLNFHVPHDEVLKILNSVEGMEVVCKEFEATSKDPQGRSIDDLITEFHSCLATKSVEGMEVVCKEFEATSKDPQGRSVDDLITEFHSCLATKLCRASTKAVEIYDLVDALHSCKQAPGKS
nr:hypothetical protein [Tanacetum cinerariifolium]